MTTYRATPITAACVFFLTLVLTAGCAPERYIVADGEQKALSGLSSQSADRDGSSSGESKRLENYEKHGTTTHGDSSRALLDDASSSPHASTTPGEQGNQYFLDSAMGFYQAGYEFWEEGDIENALDSLDQAYSLILKVDPEQDPVILQQRDDLRVTIAKRIIEVYASRFTAVNGSHQAIPLVMNSHVQKALDLFKGKHRKFFIDSYIRSGKFRPFIVASLKEAGLPEELSWLPLIESGFKVRALSRARALGLWQFIASTGYKFGLKRDHWIDERMDPGKATLAAINYLKELHQIFGDWTTALAAYNCGEGLVLRRIRTQKVNYLDNFWDLYKRLPSETAFYVPKFLAVLHIVNNPEAHGFDLPPVDEKIPAETVQMNKQVKVSTIAKHIGVPADKLMELNAELRQGTTPPRPYDIKVPSGKGQLLLAKLEDIPTWSPPVPAFATHRVARGETLSKIARKYGTSVRSIKAMNRISNSNIIRIGSRLKIPTSASRASLAAAQGSGKKVSSRQTFVTHKVARGETLSTIARRYGTSVRDIMNANHLSSTNMIRAGARLKIPASGSRASTPARPSKYVVRKGDSLWLIAQRFGTTVNAIQTANGLRTTSISIGQTLNLPARSASGASKKATATPYMVRKGDSPYIIAQKYRMDLSDFLRLNKLTPRSTIYPGQKLLVKAD
ncbi:MAG: LysM peptidoglycan-binding domain-containing protein [Desulfatiglandaceae bacterium]